MSTLLWVGLFAVTSLFWCWLIFWGGADTLEGSVASVFLLGYFASNWSAEGIRLFAWCSWVVEGFWFVAGLFVPGARFYFTP